MFRLAGGHPYGKQLFTWLSLVVSLMASFVLSFFLLDVLGEIWDLIESVSEGFLTYSFINQLFLNTFRDIGCEKIVDFPTRIDNTMNILDSNRPSLIEWCVSLPGIRE